MANGDYHNFNRPTEEPGALQKLFGPSKEEIWRQLAEQIDARYVEGGWWRGAKVVSSVGQWTITLDTYVVNNGESTTTYTRLRAPYVNRDGLRFRITRRHCFSWLAERLGLQDIEIGDQAFDEAFIIKSNDPSKVRALLQDRRLRELLSAQPRVCFEVRDDEGWFGATFPEGVDELRFLALGTIKDISRLRELFELFAVALQRLCAIGSAYEGDPGVALR